MKTEYAKGLLYAYPYIVSEIRTLDNKVIKKALSSRQNYQESCEEQAIKIAKMQIRKLELTRVKERINLALSKFDEQEMMCISRRYFKQYCKGVCQGCPRILCRNFGKNSIENRFARYLEDIGCNNAWFRINCYDVREVRRGLNMALEENEKES